MSVFYPSSIIEVNLRTKQLKLLQNQKILKSYTIAVGRKDYPTPSGAYFVTEKIINPGGILGSRWMTFYEDSSSKWGIHGTNLPWSIGKAVSKGCIRMYNHDIEELFPLVPLLTPVKILAID